jgi:cell wall-associated NlpC family hydrolase
MHVRERLGTKFVIGCVAAATVLVALPKAQGDDRPKTTNVEGVETNGQKKTKKAKRKRSQVAAQRVGLGWHGRDAAAAWTKPPVRRKSPVEIVLATARKQLGKPYRYGAVGPSSFDCSGFTMYAWAAAGVHLPHNSGAQRAATKSVPLDKMKPGDLVFSSGHVGLYIGKGRMIHSPQTGDHVEIAPLHSNVYGAGRPKP